MGKFSLLPRAAILLAGVAVGAIATRRKSRSETEAASLWRSMADLEARVEGRFQQVEQRVDEHQARLLEVPSSSKIVAAMQELLANAMNGLDQRLSDQVRSIEVLKTTVAQTDELLERVLESIYALQQTSSDGVEKPLAIER
jgi:uncharacterized membrane-anchored protein YhcB (DUF1043 family)